MINHISRICLWRFFQVAPSGIVNLYLRTGLSRRIKCRQPCRLFICRIRDVLRSIQLHDHVGTGHFLCMKPNIFRRCRFKGQMVILQIIFSHIHMESIRRQKMKRFTFLFSPLIFLSCFRLDDSRQLHLFLDFHKICFRFRHFQTVLQRKQMIQTFFAFLYQRKGCFIRTFQFIIFVKVSVRIFKRSKRFIQRNRNLLVSIIVNDFYTLLSLLCLIAICLEQFSVHSVFFPFFCILKLLCLNIIFFRCPFDRR